VKFPLFVVKDSKAGMENRAWFNYYTGYSAINSDLLNLALECGRDETPLSMPNIVLLTFTLLFLLILVVVSSKPED
jgi:hypothetical protein